MSALEQVEGCNITPTLISRNILCLTNVEGTCQDVIFSDK